MKNRVYFIIVFIFFSCVSYSANVEWMKGYVVTNESDTIYGELGYRDGTGDWKECFYRQQGEVENIKFILRNRLLLMVMNQGFSLSLKI